MEMLYTRRICKGLTKLGAIVIPYVGSTRQPIGYPDRHVIHRLWIGWIEFKSVKGRLRPAQKIRMRMMNDARPHTAVVVREGDIVEDESGNVLFTFVNCKDLLEKLAKW